MRKMLVLTAIMAILVPCAYAGVTGTIDAAVEKKMEEIRNSGKTGQNVQEIKFKRGGSQPASEATKTPETIGYIGTLSALNIVGGVFEGGIIGMSVGLIGYSQTLNMDNRPLILMPVIGVVTGAVAAVGLSVAETITGRYSMSDDFGYDILGGLFVGAAVGAAGGFINWRNTGDLENVSEGAGWGSAIGSILGLGVAIAETLMPESLRGGSIYDSANHASVIQTLDGTTVLSYNLKY